MTEFLDDLIAGLKGALAGGIAANALAFFGMMWL